MGMVQVQVDGLALDMVSNSPVVILASEELNKVLPIWIGQSEAWAIAMEISKVGSKRPMTHDLFKNTIVAMGGTLEKIEITELKEQTFYARLLVTSDGKTIDIDARPSDSIALALKMGCPMFVEEELFNIHEQAPETTEEFGDQAPGQSDEQPPTAPGESLKDRLKRIDPEDFGKYSL